MVSDDGGESLVVSDGGDCDVDSCVVLSGGDDEASDGLYHLLHKRSYCSIHINYHLLCGSG